jgi:type I restriction enzyme S subunit
LLGKKRELIEKLKEKRAALISRTVTNGVPREGRFPATAAGFLGSKAPPTPRGWKTSKVWLERVAGNLEYQDGNHGEMHPKAEDYVPTGIPFVMANDIVNGRIDFTKCSFIEPDLAKSLRIGFAQEGDVLLTHKGTIGRVGIVQENSFPYVMLTPQVTYYRCIRAIVARYLFWFFESRYWQDQMKLVSGMGTTRGYVGLLDQRFLRLILPQKPDQHAIADYLDRETAKLDRMMEKVEAAIEKLQEYRTALITAAVTGKIDVRKAGRNNSDPPSLTN